MAHQHERAPANGATHGRAQAAQRPEYSERGGARPKAGVARGMALGLACALLTAAPAAPAQNVAAAAAAQRDGAHDFDFNLGVWHTHIRRVLDPFSASSESQELHGTVTVRPVWGGRALLEEIEADGPRGHWQGLTLFLYNPASHQWSQSFADSKSGTFGTGLIGEFHDGRGALFSSDTFQGRSILVRGMWSDITPAAHRYEESYSADGGASWHAAFIADLTRAKP